jgi:hypothetical protein
MTAPIYVTPPLVRLPDPVPGPPAGPDAADLLRQVLEVQREQLAVLKTQSQTQDGGARWRAFLARWQADFPDLGSACKQVLPIVERAYLAMIQELTDRLRDPDGGLDNEFLLGEFLDRYGIRLGQLGTVLSQLGPLADAAPAGSAEG